MVLLNDPGFWWKHRCWIEPHGLECPLRRGISSHIFLVLLRFYSRKGFDSQVPVVCLQIPVFDLQTLNSSSYALLGKKRKFYFAPNFLTFYFLFSLYLLPFSLSIPIRILLSSHVISSFEKLLKRSWIHTPPAPPPSLGILNIPVYLCLPKSIKFYNDNLLTSLYNSRKLQYL